MEKWTTEFSQVILVITLLTIIVAIESLYFIPWAPYFIIYAILAIAIPVWFKTYRFGKLRELASSKVLRDFILFLILTFAILFLIDFVYFALLKAYGIFGNSMYDLTAALQELAEIAASKFNITVETAITIYGVYVLIWAPIGEEFLYRGYVYGCIRKKYNTHVAAIISSFFFGIRHMTHFLFLPVYPLFASIYWAIHAFIFGVIMAYAYERTNTLYVPMIIHFIFNLICSCIG